MRVIDKLRIILTIYLLLVKGFFVAQNYTFNISKTAETCTKGVALLEITGTDAKDSVAINWSSGEKNVKQVLNMDAGDYNVYIYIKRKVTKDTVIHKDTIIYFTIERQECPVIISDYFSPNDDGYNDLMQISNTTSYPDFELHIFNKWGQRVHYQEKNYVPWDGKWIGLELPDATYYYMFFYSGKDKKKVEKGDVTILR